MGGLVLIKVEDGGLGPLEEGKEGEGAWGLGSIQSPLHVFYQFVGILGGVVFLF